MKFRATLVVLLVALIATLIVDGLQNTSSEKGSVTKVAQSTVSLIEKAKKQGLPVWLLFHSTTCQSCIEMEQLFQALKPEFDDKVVFINVDVNSPLEKELCDLYQIKYVPTTVFLNSKGVVAFNYVGVIKPDEMKSKLKALWEGK